MASYIAITGDTTLLSGIRSYRFLITQAANRAVYGVTCWGVYVTYKATASDTVQSIAQKLTDKINATPAFYWNLFGIAPVGRGLFPPQAYYTAGDSHFILVVYKTDVFYAYEEPPAPPDGVGFTISGYDQLISSGATTPSASEFYRENNLPLRVKVYTGKTINFNFFRYPATPPNLYFGVKYIGPFLTTGPEIESIVPPGGNGPNMQVVWKTAGTTTMQLIAARSGGVPYSSDIVTVEVVWSPLNSDVMRFVTNEVEGWESLPTYNSKYVDLNDPPVNLTTFKGWSAPIAAADQLDYLRRQQTSISKWFPDYIGYGDTYDMMSLNWKGMDINPPVYEGYGYPSWKRFTLDENRPARNSTIDSTDMTDFGWWMNTSNLGNIGVTGTNDPLYLGTTARGIYDGLNMFYSHAGHSDVVTGIFKQGNKILGSPFPEYKTNAQNSLTAYQDMAVELINNNKPFLIHVSGKGKTEVFNNQPLSTSWGPVSVSGLSSFTYTIPIYWVVPGIKYQLTLLHRTFTYVSTASDTPITIIQILESMINSVSSMVWIANNPSHQFKPGFPPLADVNIGTKTLLIYTDNITSVIMNVTWDSGVPPAVTTYVDTIYSTGMDASVGPERIRDIYALDLTTANADWNQLNDNASALTPINGIGGDTDTATGNTYLVIGYCKRTFNSNLPTDAQNKFLLICKDTGSDRQHNVYFTLDSPLKHVPGVTSYSLWDRLIATYVVSASQSTYVSPRDPLIGNFAGGQSACVGVPVNVTPPLVSGTPADNRFTHVFFGVGLAQTVNGSTSINPRTFVTPGNYTVQYKVTDGVSHNAGTFILTVNPSVNPVFDIYPVAAATNVPISSVPSPLAVGYAYEFSPVQNINNNFTYTWTINRNDTLLSPSDYTITQGTLTTAGPIRIRFNVPGQFSVTLTTQNSGTGGCSGQYSRPIEANVVNLDFTYTQPVFSSLPITFSGSCSTAVETWSWTFGDGQTGTGQSPTHTYVAIGTVNVTLEVVTQYGRLTVTKQIQVLPANVVADFTYSPLSNLLVGETIEFIDLSTPQPISGLIIGQWDWDFGDGTTSTSQNPSHAFTTPGVHTVSLTYTIFYGPGFSLSDSDTVSKQMVLISGAPIVKSQTFITSRNLITSYDLSDFTTSSNPITFSIVNPPKNGIAEFVTPTQIQYQPNLNYSGSDVITFRATDDLNLYSNGNINLLVREPKLTVIVGEVLNNVGIITIKLGTTDINRLLLKQVVIQNTGQGDLLISNMSIVDDSAGVFSLYDVNSVLVPSFTNLLLKPKEIFSFNIGINSPVIGTFQSRLQVDHN